MRLLLFLLLTIGVMFAVVLLLVPLVVDHGSTLLGALGVLLLVGALVLPRRRCSGFEIHCTGCRHH